ncbi:MAG: M23 family metallopeptidase, partial [Burkholderiaceae bacterium]
HGVRPAALRDTFDDGRTTGPHEALDIPAPMRTPVFAVEDGVVAKLFTSQRGGLTVYHFDPSSRYVYYYAHLDAYPPGLREGQQLKRCALVGYVGVSGNSPADVPHLHFAIFKLEAERQWWRGAPVNPYQALRETSAAPCPLSAGG